MTIWAIIPVKPLRDGKSRLSHILSADERAALTSKFLNHTLATLTKVSAITRTLVISRDPAVLKIARPHGAQTFGEGEKQDLNQALTRATHIAAAQNASGVLVLPADLPFVTPEDVEMMLMELAPAVNGNGQHRLPYHARAMIICPDEVDDGTNGLYISPPVGFNFHYGPQSYHHHLAEAKRLGMSARVVHTPGLKFDLDSEADWQTYLALTGRVQYEMA